MSPEPSQRKRAAYGLPPSPQAILQTASDVQSLMANGINLDGSLRPEAIRALLKLRNVNLRALAETNGYADPYIHQVINRERHDVVVENILAAAMGLDADRIWARRREDIA